MTSLNSQLWELIETHKMPDDATDNSFIDQLMTENSISLDTAKVAIKEYKKFMYLCGTRSDRNVPSKAVDLVWHLHMQHSRDYWEIFCKKLGKPVHHTPVGEGVEHLKDYKSTVQAYRQIFGQPPKGIWRESSKAGSLVTIVFAVVFLTVGIASFDEFENALAALVFLTTPVIMIFAAFNSWTAGGQLALVFETGDPFADEDAGDCGSGDGGGCGD